MASLEGIPAILILAAGLAVALGIAWWLAGRVRLHLHLGYRLRSGVLRGWLVLALPGDRPVWRAPADVGHELALLTLAWLLLPLPPGRAARRVQRALRRVRVRRLRWRTRLGLDDAALTGMAAGLLWAVKGAAVARIARRHGPPAEAPHVRLETQFGAWLLESEARCIVELSLRDIMVAAPIAWGLLGSRRRGGAPAGGRAPGTRARPGRARRGGWAWGIPSSS